MNLRHFPGSCGRTGDPPNPPPTPPTLRRESSGLESQPRERWTCVVPGVPRDWDLRPGYSKEQQEKPEVGISSPQSHLWYPSSASCWHNPRGRQPAR